MSLLRKKRLLLLATKPKGHTYFYKQYRELEYEGYVFWMFGYANLTIKGRKFLNETTN